MRRRFFMSVALLAFVGQAYSTNALAADPFFCSPSRKEICNYDKPCEVVPVDDFLVIIDDETNVYMRCDKPDRATCVTYTMVKSGDYKRYMTYEIAGHGGFSKLGPDGDWAEAVSLAGMIVVSHGMCSRASALKQ